MSKKNAFVPAWMFEQVIMSELAEARAKAGYCPKCQGASLRHKHTGAGLSFHHCGACGAIAVLGAPPTRTDGATGDSHE